MRLVIDSYADDATSTHTNPVFRVSGRLFGADAFGPPGEWVVTREPAGLRGDIEKVTAERDDAQARVRELEAMSSTATIRDVHKALGATVGQSVVTRAEEVMALLADAERQRDQARVMAAATHMVHIRDARTALGACDGESLTDAAKRSAERIKDLEEHVREERKRTEEAGRHTRSVTSEILGILPDLDESLTDQARRVVAERDSARRERDEAKVLISNTIRHLEPLAPGPYRDVVHLAARVVLAETNPEPANVTRAAAILCDALLIDDTGVDIDSLAKMAADQITAVRAALRWEGEGSCGTLAEHARDVRAIADEAPVQVFRPSISVHISRTAGANGWLRANVDVDDITDPGFLSLTGKEYARLALVVLRG